MRFRTRTELVCAGPKALGLKAGVEVGFREGNLSRLTLASSEMTLVGIDIRRHDQSLGLDSEFPGRWSAVIEASPASAARFADGAFDFVHVDADHSYAAVAADLAAWWPKCAPGGLFSGDDYCTCACPSEGEYGVVRAAGEFADRLGLTLYVTGLDSTDRTEQERWGAYHGAQSHARHSGQPWLPYDVPAWYVYKPGA